MLHIHISNSDWKIYKQEHCGILVKVLDSHTGGHGFNACSVLTSIDKVLCTYLFIMGTWHYCGNVNCRVLMESSFNTDEATLSKWYHIYCNHIIPCFMIILSFFSSLGP